jgi:hypothetical protein
VTTAQLANGAIAGSLSSRLLMTQNSCSWLSCARGKSYDPDQRRGAETRVDDHVVKVRSGQSQVQAALAGEV